MKKLIFGIALFGGTFALTNEIVKANTVKGNNTSTENYKINCGPNGTCTIDVYCNGFGNPPTGHYEYSGVTYEWCQAKTKQLIKKIN